MRVAIRGPDEALMARVAAGLGDTPIVDAGEDVRVHCLAKAGRTALKAGGLLEDVPERRIIVVDGFPTPTGMRVLATHLDGVVLSDRLEETLLVTLQAVHAGQRVLPSEFAARLKRPPLSAREKQILALVVLDASNAEIAQRLWVTESAVKNHLTSAFAKLGVRSRAAAADLISDPEGGLGLGILRITPEAEEAS